MGADEIIEQIKALPPSEQKKVFAFFHETIAKSLPQVRYMDHATFDAAMDRVFVTHDELFRRLAND